MRTMVKAKLHDARVTMCDLDYEGSISIDSELLREADLWPYEFVQVTNYANGVLWRTYVIAAPPGSGTLGLNGPPARLFRPGDRVTVLGFAHLPDAEARCLRPRVVFFDHSGPVPNRIETVRVDRVDVLLTGIGIEAAAGAKTPGSGAV